MAFCNSCGATLDVGARFCNKCGTTQPVSASSAAPAAVSSATSAAPARNGNTVKIVLMVVAVLVGLAILGMGSAAFLTYRFAKHTRVHDENGNVRVETPFGMVQSITDPEEAARNLGVDLYPGAEVTRGSAANMSFGGMKTVAADFETDDPPSAVADFYKQKYPGARVVSSEGDHFTLVSTDNKNILTINVEPRGGKSRIHIAKVSKPGGGEDSEN